MSNLPGTETPARVQIVDKSQAKAKCSNVSQTAVNIHVWLKLSFLPFPKRSLLSFWTSSTLTSPLTSLLSSLLHTPTTMKLSSSWCRKECQCLSHMRWVHQTLIHGSMFFPAWMHLICPPLKGCYLLCKYMHEWRLIMSHCACNVWMSYPDMAGCSLYNRFRACFARPEHDPWLNTERPH